MADYIKREDVVERLVRAFLLQAPTARAIVENIPAADVVDRKTGKWTVIENDAYADGDINSVQYWCSACNDWNTYGESNYCPNCGADMRGEF